MPSIIGLPEYINYHYHPNFISFFTLFTFLYSIPPVIITIWMTKYLVKNWRTMTKTGLRSDIFGLFLAMQIANELNILLGIMSNRVPITGILTSYCASVNPQQLIDNSQLILMTLVHMKNLSTMLFCVVRVAMMYLSKMERKMYFKELTVTLVAISIISAILSFIRNEESSTCMQLEPPYSFGALKIVLVHPIDDKAPYSKIEQFMYPTIIFILLVSTAMTFWKLHQLRVQSRNLSIPRKKTNLKSEKTLTGTMVLILLPILMTEIIVICESMGSDIFVLGLIRGLFGDARAHVVTCYFYWTHPIFKKKVSLKKIDTFS